MKDPDLDDMRPKSLKSFRHCNQFFEWFQKDPRINNKIYCILLTLMGLAGVIDTKVHLMFKDSHFYMSKCDW